MRTMMSIAVAVVAAAVLLGAAEGITTQRDRASLAKLRNVTKWEELQRSWRKGTDPCTDWDFVECDDPKMPGTVTRLHITDTKLTGKIPFFILCEFKSLIELDIDGNPQLHGTIPSWFANCFDRLEELDFSRTGVTGNLPASLFASKTIRELEFEYTKISGSLPPCRSPSLQSLELFGTNPGLSGAVPKSYKVAQGPAGASWVLKSNFRDKSGICKTKSPQEKAQEKQQTVTKMSKSAGDAKTASAKTAKTAKAYTTGSSVETSTSAA